MNTPRATVSKVLPFSCVDGPGNRLVLFLQGCNFACVTCHNPHTMGVCTHCGDCVPACHAGALSLAQGKIRFNPALCDQCDDCLRACPVHANPMVREIPLEEALAITRENLAFLDGVTVSGGEATTQLKFVTAYFQAIKADPELAHLSCLIDSNGHLPPAAWERLLPVTDGVMLDIKALDPAIHRRLTGQDNARVLQSAALLHRSGRLHEIRFLVIPDQTDTDAETEALARFVAGLDPQLPVRLNAFQTHGVTGDGRCWPAATRDCVEKVAERLAAAGLENVSKPIVYI